MYVCNCVSAILPAKEHAQVQGYSVVPWFRACVSKVVLGHLAQCSVSSKGGGPATFWNTIACTCVFLPLFWRTSQLHIHSGHFAPMSQNLNIEKGVRGEVRDLCPNLTQDPILTECPFVSDAVP